MKNKLIVITGASRGLGEGLARLAAKEGAVVALAARSLDRLTQISDELKEEGYKAHPFYLDVRKVDSIKECFTHIEKKLGPIDILINNAGMGNPIEAVNISEADWDEMVDLNLKGAFFCSQEVGKRMISRKKGRIINISSQAGDVVIQDESVYCTTKAALKMLTKALAYEWAQHNVTVNAVAPTFIRTPGTAARLDDPEFSKTIIERIPVGRVAQIDEVWAAIKYFSSAEASIVTGVQLLLDGGWTLP